MNQRTLIRRIANRARDLLFAPGSERIWSRRMRGCITALLYHRVSEPGTSFLDHGAPPTPPDQLERELRFLNRIGARFTTFDQLLDQGFPQDQEIRVVVTFDDCMQENYGQALDIVEGAGARAVLFQITSLIDSNTLLWEHELYWHLKNDGARRLAQSANLAGISSLTGSALVETLRESVSPDRVARLLDSARPVEAESELHAIAASIYPAAGPVRDAAMRGHQIGSHGAHHYKRSTMNAALFENECRDSRDTLTSLVGRPPNAFSYPFSSVAPGDQAIVQKYYRQAMIVAPGGDANRIRQDTDPYRIPRFTWRGPFQNGFRERRWLLEGTS